MHTLFQVAGLTDAQVDMLCVHLGHTKDVHMRHYKYMEEHSERVVVGKLMLLQDMNLLHKFDKKQPNEFTIEEFTMTFEPDTNPVSYLTTGTIVALNLIVYL